MKAYPGKKKTRELFYDYMWIADSDPAKLTPGKVVRVKLRPSCILAGGKTMKT